MKISAVHMNSVLADVDHNMNIAENEIKKAKEKGAEIVVLPEFFSTGFAYTPKIPEAVLKYENPQIKLSMWAKKYDIIIGGSYIWFNGKEGLNTFSLTFPSGQIYTHSKDIPTVYEHFCYTYGDRDSVFQTPIGNIGVAMCWEQLRTDTVKRMIGKVDLLLTCSCWWGFCEDDPEELQALSDYHHELAVNAPIELSKIFGVPVIHASHHAVFEGLAFFKGQKRQTRTIVGATQIINEKGDVIDRKMFNEDGGIITAEININSQLDKTNEYNEENYWIPNLPPVYLRLWEKVNPFCEKYYNDVTKTYYLNNYK